MLISIIRNIDLMLSARVRQRFFASKLHFFFLFLDIFCCFCLGMCVYEKKGVRMVKEKRNVKKKKNAKEGVLEKKKLKGKV